AYSDLLAKLPAFLINKAWIRLTSRKRNPLSEIEASGINPIVESFLKHEYRL
ncbi:5055_t:CDS:2, partial [Ambispora leptoticha]